MRARSSTRWRAAAVVAVAVASCACGPSGGVEVADWELIPPNGEATAISMPVKLDQLPSERSEYRLRSEVALPPELRDRALRLVVPYFGGLATLLVNGDPVRPRREPVSGAYRHSGVHEWWIPARYTASPSISLELRVRHEWYHSGWWLTVPRLVDAERGDSQAEALHGVNTIGAALTVVGLAHIGLVYLVIFFFDRRRKDYLWFALQALFGSYYGLWLLGYSQVLFGRVDVAFLCASLCTAPLMTIYFTHEYFALGPPSKFWKYLLVVDLVACALTIEPWQNVAFLVWLFLASITCVVVYEIQLCARLLRRGTPRQGALILLVAWALIGVTGFADASLFTGMGAPFGGVHLILPAMAIFAVLQSLLLSREHVQVNAELTQRVEEISVLNEDLRRQISERSGQLYAALALISGAEGDAPVLKSGDIIQNRYRVRRLVGTGGMGSVYEVERVQDGRRFALKLTHGITGPSLARLAREAQIASQIDHPNIVSIHDVDIATSGFLYLVMEFVDGPSVSEQKQNYGKRGWAMAILRQTAEALDALHEIGIVHRDLKPANVLITAESAADGDPCIKLTDFGISRLGDANAEEPGGDSAAAEILATATLTLADKQPSPEPRSVPEPGDEPTADTGPLRETVPRARGKQRRGSTSSPSPNLTAAGDISGTPAYMAPEVTEANCRITSTSDLFSFGVMAFELLAGSRPYEEPPALTRLRTGELPEPLPSITTRCDDLSADVARVIDACLSYEPSERPTARQVAEALTPE